MNDCVFFTSVTYVIDPNMDPFQNSENTTYENCFVKFRI